MNKIYRHIWSKVHNMLIPVSEIAGSVSPKSSPRQKGIEFNNKNQITEKKQKAQLARALALLLAGVSPVALALPSGGHVQHGQASIHVQGNNLTVDQGTKKAIINWQKFGIQPNESVNFNQPNLSSITLNRVIGNNPSKIMGHLSANGQIFLVNPSGITFGQNASVDTGGIVASTLNISNQNFLNGNYQFKGQSSKSVLNKGDIQTSQGGSVAFIGHQVNNQGQILTPGGTTAMGAGSRVDLTLSKNHLLHFAVKKSALKASAKNGGLIKANHGGTVILSGHAKNTAMKTVVNNQGVVRAHSVQNNKGHIALLGGQSGTTKVSGTLDASANTNTSTNHSKMNTSNQNPSQQVNGGSIETSGAHVKIANDSKITTKGKNGGQNGNWTIDPTNFTIGSNTSNSDITGTNLSSKLNNNSVKIKSSQGTNGNNGNVVVNAPVSWSSNKLTLSAYNDIKVNATMNVNSNGSLAFYYGQGSSNGNINGTQATDQVNKPVNLSSNASFTTKLGSNGIIKNYTIVNSLGKPNSTNSNTLQGMAANSNLSNNYVLGTNINAQPTGTNTSVWGNNGFSPIGNKTSNSSNAFTGTFDGLGHTIKQLHITRSSQNHVGLFGVIKQAYVKNTSLKSDYTIGHKKVGSLIGLSSGSSNAQSYILNDSNNSSSNGQVKGHNLIGGLVGSNGGYSRISHSSASGTVTTNGFGSNNSNVAQLGGLVAHNSGSIVSSYVNSVVSASSSNNGGIKEGGLIGVSGRYTTVKKDHANGQISGSNGTNGASIVVGGLIGSNQGLVSKSYAKDSVNVSATGISSINAGGLIGSSRHYVSSINHSYATGNVTVKAHKLNRNKNVGGLAGFLNGPLSNSYATGNIQTVGSMQSGYQGADLGGGLAGFIGNYGKIQNSYATGSVTSIGTNSVYRVVAGGLVGRNKGQIKKSYATGAVVAKDKKGHNFIVNNMAGGLVGLNSNLIKNSYSKSKVKSKGNHLSRSDNSGGLVGFNKGKIVLSHSSGNVYSSGNYNGATSQGAFSGGLVGFQRGTGFINKSFAIGNASVSGNHNAHIAAGGLVGGGFSTETIKRSYAKGNVSVVGNSNSGTRGRKNAVNAGGLIGLQFRFYAGFGHIHNVYARGSVTAQGSNNSAMNVGGLIGTYANGNITQAYATGAISASGSSNSSMAKGGLVGRYDKFLSSNSSYIKHSYWDTSTTGVSNGIGVNKIPSSNVAVTGLTDSQMMQQSNFNGFDFTKVPIWKIYNGQTKPLLVWPLTPLTISGGPSSSKIYGKKVSQLLLDYTYSIPSAVNSSHLKAQIGNANSTNNQYINVGSNYTTDFYSNQQGYRITVNNPKKVTIKPKSLTASIINNPTKTYNGTNGASVPAGDTQLKGFVGNQGAQSKQITGTYAQASASTNIKITESINSSNFSPNSNTSLSNYTLPSQATGLGTIKPKSLTASLANAPTKTYNGTNGATIASGNINLSGFVGNQGATSKKVTGHYSQSNAGSNIKVSASISSSNFSPNSNTTLSNYKIPSSVSSSSGVIKPKSLTASFANAPTKTYNGTNGATIASGNINLSGFVGNQGATSKKVTGHYNQSGAGSNIKVSANISSSNFSPNSNTSFANYTIPSSVSSTSGVIKPKQLSANILNNPTKTYNGTNGITLAGSNISLNGFVGSQGGSISSKQVKGQYSQANAGSKISVSANINNSNVSTQSNTSISNYNLPSKATGSFSGTGTIKPKSLTASFANAPTKTYNGTNGATIASGNINLNGFVGNQGVTSKKVTGSYAQSGAGSNIKVSANISSSNFNPNSNTTLSNYTIPSSVSGTGVIKPKQLTANILNNPTKTYNGTNGITLAGSNVSLNGFVGSQGGSISSKQLSGQYSQANAGSNVSVSANLSNSNVSTKSNTSLSNYNLPSKATGSFSGTGTIKPKQLSASIINNPTKTYNGTNGATIPAGDTKLSGFVGNQGAQSKQISGTYAQASAGTNIKITESLSSSDFNPNSNTQLSNYKIPSTATGTGTIKPKNLTLSSSITSHPTKVYNGTNGATIAKGNITLSGFQGSQSSYNSSKQVSGHYAQSSVGSNIKVTAPISTNDFNISSNVSISNYTVPNKATGTGTIQPKSLSASIINNPTKTYNGSNIINIPSGDVQLKGFVGHQGATSKQVSGSFNQSNAGNSIKVHTSVNNSNFSPNSNTKLSNYTITNSGSVTGMGTIQPKQLTANISGNPTKTYNGTNSVTIGSGHITLNGFVGNQGASSSTKQVTGSFNQSGAGSNVKLSAKLNSNDFRAHSNTLLSNYNIPSQTTNHFTGTGSIKPRSVSISHISADNKSYNGNKLANLDINQAKLNNVVSGDNVQLINTKNGKHTGHNAGTFASSNAGQNIAVTPHLGLTGNAASNYQLKQPSGLSANINSAPVSARISGKVSASNLVNNTATLNSSNYQLHGLIGNQSITVTQTQATYNQSSLNSNTSNQQIQVQSQLTSNDFKAGSNTSLSNYKLPSKATGHVTINGKVSGKPSQSSNNQKIDNTQNYVNHLNNSNSGTITNSTNNSTSNHKSSSSKQKKKNKPKKSKNICIKTQGNSYVLYQGIASGSLHIINGGVNMPQGLSQQAISSQLGASANNSIIGGNNGAHSLCFKPKS